MSRVKQVPAQVRAPRNPMPYFPVSSAKSCFLSRW